MSGALVPTKASLEKGVQKVEEVTFVSYKPKKKSERVQENQQNEESDTNYFNIKKAKNEMIKFALSDLEGKEKRNAMMQLAIKLGAKPPRRKFRNYKSLIEERKKEKAEEETKEYLRKIGKNSIGESIAKTNLAKKNKKKFKKSVDILDIYGKVKKAVEK
ncbi:uncharacterized protein C1orf131 [Coccinella septempunctata]|uniref:uncharacterized protein C1orf131 n=1 Tax=Coccinella septempunctata TaxID=41139 RepID=UPI001D05DF7A|nr:uncharacterized protein C1orf131 [Coccinella septempunctata]